MFFFSMINECSDFFCTIDVLIMIKMQVIHYITTLCQNTKYCNQIIVVYVHAKSTQLVRIKPGSNSKNAADCAKTVCWGVK